MNAEQIAALRPSAYALKAADIYSSILGRIHAGDRLSAALRACYPMKRRAQWRAMPRDRRRAIIVAIIHIHRRHWITWVSVMQCLDPAKVRAAIRDGRIPCTHRI